MPSFGVVALARAPPSSLRLQRRVLLGSLVVGASVAASGAVPLAATASLCEAEVGSAEAQEALDLRVELLQRTPATFSVWRGVPSALLSSTAGEALHRGAADLGVSQEPKLASQSRIDDSNGTRRNLQHRTWDAARSKAEETLKALTVEQRDSLLRGAGWQGESPLLGFYIGNIPAIASPPLTALKMQDSGNGFRQSSEIPAGTTTAWPSLLALATTWEDSLVEEVAAAIGREFRGKGANVLLGPSIQVHRTAWGGRNFEYLSGEDPVLGARLASAYVRGAQSEGVMCVAKHFAFNEQEGNRNIYNSIVDARTAWELYYPPFEAAVQAGVGAVMCSYNRVNGTHSCLNSELLKGDLKGKMGFRGFVMSDWFATYNNLTAIEEGLDQDMPGPGGEPNIFSDANLAELPQQSVDEAAVRVMSSAYMMKLDEDPGCAPPLCEGPRASYQRLVKHRALAREAAAHAVVLLKNDGLLPLGRPGGPRTLAVVGSAANPKLNLTNEMFADYFSGGGSGHVTPGSWVTALQGLEARASELGLVVIASPSNNVTSALRAARDADVVLVVAGTTSTESMDRPSLHLDGGADDLIHAVARERPTVVLMQTPGAVLTPWRDEVSAVLNVFLAGEETGAAWSHVVFGDLMPYGRLPIMFPVSEADTIKPDENAETVVYKEGLFTSYRNPSFKASFPFGHGLTYTSFSYGEPWALPGQGCGARACFSVRVANVGAFPGSEVVQVYLEFPSAGPATPRLQLRAFQRTALLQPLASEVLTFSLSDRDLSIYRPGPGWSVQAGARAHIGASSADIRHVLPLEE